MAEEPIHPSFFSSQSDLEFKIAETSYFLEEMREAQGRARKAQSSKRPVKMNEQRTIFTYFLSAFVGSAYGLRELFARATDGDSARKTWLKNVTDTPLCHFFGMIREMNTHRSVVSAGMSYRFKFVGGKTQIDLGVVFGQKSSNPYMSPLFFSIDASSLNKPTAKAHRDLEAVEGTAFSITIVAAKYLDELRSIFLDGVSQGVFQ